MNDELTNFSRVFQDEDALRKSIASLFRHRSDVSGVEITHGPLERGKDLVFYVGDPIGERKLYACVVKHGKITGSADSDKGAMNVLTQVTQALENPYLNPAGQHDDVAHVFVMTPHEVSQSAMFSIQGALRSRSGQVTFCCGGKLLNLFRKYWPDFMLESGDLGIYISQMQSQIEKDDPVTILLSEHSVFGPPSQFRRTYVKQRFRCPLVEYRCALVVPTIRRFTDPIEIEEARLLKTSLRNASELVALPHIWYEGSLGEQDTSALASFLRGSANVLIAAWEKGYDSYVKQNPGVNRLPKAEAAVRLQLEPTLLDDLESKLKQVRQCVRTIESKISEANQFVRGASSFGDSCLHARGHLVYCTIREIANRVPSVVQPMNQETTFYLQETLLEAIDGSILITGSAGHGKTSFCQHYAGTDAKALVNNTSNVLPVYVKLHHLASRQLGGFREEFFPTTELRALTKKIGGSVKPRIKKIRVYLDGLDEVPRVERQRELMELAKSAVDSDPRIQVIVTARNYVNGPWLNWMPRVAISELDEKQISDLVGGLLGDDVAEVEKFFRELKKVPSLEPLMHVPLLGTLIISVYKKRTALPENRVRLYETFLNLMCGGWDLAKNVRRRTDFGSVGKLSVLTRLAGHMQLNRERECNEQSIRVAVTSSNPAYVTQCGELTEELLQDGALTRSGTSYTFCHLSFQEYLAAKELNDPSGRRQQNILRWYFRGEDWWYQMLSFYIGTLGKPEDTEHWLRSSFEEASASGGVADDAPDRYRRLVKCIVESAPGYSPKSKAPPADSDTTESEDTTSSKSN
jgi:hypothetical protein